jgi:hypothetical protein
MKRIEELRLISPLPPHHRFVPRKSRERRNHAHATNSTEFFNSIDPKRPSKCRDPLSERAYRATGGVFGWMQKASICDLIIASPMIGQRITD